MTSNTDTWVWIFIFKVFQTESCPSTFGKRTVDKLHWLAENHVHFPVLNFRVLRYHLERLKWLRTINALNSLSLHKKLAVWRFRPVFVYKSCSFTHITQISDCVRNDIWLSFQRKIELSGFGWELHLHLENFKHQVGPATLSYVQALNLLRLRKK